jgi:hypothetical protein
MSDCRAALSAIPFPSAIPGRFDELYPVPYYQSDASRCHSKQHTVPSTRRLLCQLQPNRPPSHRRSKMQPPEGPTKQKRDESNHGMFSSALLTKKHLLSVEVAYSQHGARSSFSAPFDLIAEGGLRCLLEYQLHSFSCKCRALDVFHGANLVGHFLAL